MRLCPINGRHINLPIFIKTVVQPICCQQDCQHFTHSSEPHVGRPFEPQKAQLAEGIHKRNSIFSFVANDWYIMWGKFVLQSSWTFGRCIYSQIVSSVGNFLVPLHIAFRSRGPIHFKYSIFNLVCIGNALISGAQDNIHRDTSPSLVEVSYSYNSLNTALKIRDTWKPPWRRNPWTRSSRKHFVLRKPSSNINGCSVAVSGLVLYFRSVCLTEPRCSWLWSSCWLLLLFYYSPGVKGWRTIGIYYLDLSVWAFEVLSF